MRIQFESMRKLYDMLEKGKVDLKYQFSSGVGINTHDKQIIITGNFSEKEKKILKEFGKIISE